MSSRSHTRAAWYETTTRIRTIGDRPAIRGLLIGVLSVGLYLALQPGLWNGKTFLGWDVLRFSWPNLESLFQSLRHGELPLWMPFDKAGYAFIGDPEAAPLYPVSWLLCLIRAFLGYTPVIILLQVLIHVAIAALGVQLYLARHGVDAPARWLGSTTYVLCARLAKSKDQTVLGSVVWLPWMVLAVEATVRRPSWRTAIPLGLVVGVDLLAGYPPNVFRNVLALVFVFGWELAVTWPRVSRRPRYVRQLLTSLSLAVGIAGALAAPVLIAVVGTFQDTARATMTTAEVLHSSLAPGDALNLLIPSLSANKLPLLYLGLAPALLALVALVRQRGRRWMWAAVTIVFFLLACGGRAFLLPLLVKHLAIFRYWRVSEQYLFVSAFFACVLAAHGLQDLLTGALSRRRWQLGAVVLGAIAIALLPLARAAALIELDRTVLLVLTATALVATAITRGRKRQLAAWATLAVLVLDLGVTVRPIYDILQPWPHFARDRHLAELDGIETTARIADDNYFGDRVGARRSVRDLLGLKTALVSERYQQYVAAAQHSYALLAAANVRYYAGARWRQIAQQAPTQVRPVVDQIVELRRHAPLAFWSNTAKVVPNAESALATLARSTGEPLAVLEEDELTAAERTCLLPTGAPVVPTVAAQLQVFARNHLGLRIAAPEAGVVVINEPYAPGWQATVDGRPARLLRANYLFRGLLVARGAHTIELSYRPPRLMVALALYLLVVVAVLAALGTIWYRRVRPLC